MPSVTVPFADYQVEYNGWVFPGESTYTKSINSKAHYDEAGRTIAWVEYEITICSTVVADPGRTTDDQIAEARRRLNSPAGQLRYEQRGIGPFSINVNGAGGVRDVRWGPRPLALRLTPLGNANVFEIEWTVLVCIPECEAAKYEDHVAIWNWSIQFERDADGFTTRKLSGHVLIPQTRDAQQNRQFRHTADEYREKIAPRVPFGFRSANCVFKLNDAKDKLEYQFTDEEMGTEIPPPGVLRVAADMDMQNDGPGKFVRFIYTLNATYTLARGAPAEIARVHFGRMALRRREAAKKAAVKQGATGALDLYWRVGEPTMYQRAKQARFSLVFALTRDQPMALQADGFWTPVPDSNWQLWAASLNGSIFKMDGKDARADVGSQAGLHPLSASSDIIVDLCQADVPEAGRMRSERKAGPGAVLQNARGEDRPTSDTGGWLAWDQAFHFECNGATYIHKSLSNAMTNRLRSGGGGVLRTPAMIPSSGGRMFSAPNDGSVSTEAAAVVGHRTAPTWYVVFYGRAARVGAPIQCPVIQSVGSVPVVPANRPGDGFRSSRVPGLNVVHLATWRLRFLVPTRIGTSGNAPNPTFPGGTELVEWRPNGDDLPNVGPSPDFGQWGFELEGRTDNVG